MNEGCHSAGTLREVQRQFGRRVLPPPAELAGSVETLEPELQHIRTERCRTLRFDLVDLREGACIAYRHGTHRAESEFWTHISERELGVPPGRSRLRAAPPAARRSPADALPCAGALRGHHQRGRPGRPLPRPGDAVPRRNFNRILAPTAFGLAIVAAGLWLLHDQSLAFDPNELGEAQQRIKRRSVAVITLVTPSLAGIEYATSCGASPTTATSTTWTASSTPSCLIRRRARPSPSRTGARTWRTSKTCIQPCPKATACGRLT